MKRASALFALLLLFAVGCGETPVADKDAGASDGKSDTAVAKTSELDQVDAVGLESVLAANSMTLIEFTATW